MTATQYDKLAHLVSLQIAHLYHLSKDYSKIEDVQEDLLMAFRCVRRGMGKDLSDKRYKANEAYNAMQGT